MERSKAEAVIEAIIRKVTSKELIYKYSKILSSVKDSFQTSLSETDITKLIQKELENENIKIDIIKADVSKKADVLAMISYVIEKYHRIDVLINNAGISQERLFTDINDEEWNEIIDVNLNSVYYCTKAVIPYMIQRKSGCIINISSIWGVTGGSCEVGYSTSKAAIIGFSKALAKEMGPSNIRINCIAPGIIDTDMNKNLNENDIEAKYEDGTLKISIPKKEQIENKKYIEIK